MPIFSVPTRDWLFFRGVTRWPFRRWTSSATFAFLTREGRFGGGPLGTGGASGKPASNGIFQALNQRGTFLSPDSELAFLRGRSLAFQTLGKWCRSSGENALAVLAAYSKH